MCHWWSSLWVKVKIHHCSDGANNVPRYFYLNWDIFFKWNAFKITVMSCSMCPGFNVKWSPKYLHVARSCRFYPYRQPLTHVHCSICTIIPMPMKQPWRIWVYESQESNRTHTSNQTKHNKIMCVFYWLYCIAGIIPTAQIIVAYEFCAWNWQLFIVLKIAGNNTFFLLSPILSEK